MNRQTVINLVSILGTVILAVLALYAPELLAAVR